MVTISRCLWRANRHRRYASKGMGGGVTPNIGSFSELRTKVSKKNSALPPSLPVRLIRYTPIPNWAADMVANPIAVRILFPVTAYILQECPRGSTRKHRGAEELQT